MTLISITPNQKNTQNKFKGLPELFFRLSLIRLFLGFSRFKKLQGFQERWDPSI